MNLKLKRLVRTTSSEQYALFDLNQINAEQQPTTIGKLDMHYTNEGIYGTILLWDDVSRAMDLSQRKELVQILLDEISTPMGVPNEYVFEFFAPTLDEYEVIHNVGLELANEEVVEEEVVEPVAEEVFGSGTVADLAHSPAPLPQDVARYGEEYIDSTAPNHVEPTGDVERAL